MSGNRPARPVGYAIECRGAWLRAQVRSVATIISVTGCVDGTNVDFIVRNLSRFASLDSPLIVDLREAAGNHRSAVERLIAHFGAHCRHNEVDWALVTDFAMPDGLDTHVLRTGSVGEALQHFIQAINTRRSMPLAGVGGYCSAPKTRPLQTGS